MKKVYSNEKKAMLFKFQDFLDSKPAIIDIINHVDLPNILNPTFSGHHPIKKIVTKDNGETEAIVNDKVLFFDHNNESHVIAYDILAATIKILKSEKLRYSGINGNGGDFGRVQIFINEKWTSIKGLTDKNFKI